MKKIGIDARLYFQTGVGTYLRNFFNYLQQEKTDDYIFYIYVLKEDSQKIKFEEKNFIKREVNSRWHSFSEQTAFLRAINKDDLDLMHFTYFSYPIFYQKKFIATIHDTTPLIFRTGKASAKGSLIYGIKYQALKLVLSTQVKNAAVIITPSFSVKSEITSLFGSIYENKILPIYEGVNFELEKTPENISLKNKFPFDFFIYVGNFYPHKNVEKLITAFAEVKPPAKLILIGPDDFFAKRLPASPGVIFYHDAKPEDLIFFYKNAKALLHPSLSEGFGLPLIEAAHFGCPIIASDIPVFKELLDSKYIAFNPNSREDIVLKINDFLESPQKFDYSEILKKYSFREMTKKTINIYKSVAFG